MSKQSMQEQLKQYMEDNGLSMTAITRGVDYSPAAISQWFNGTYDGSSANIDDAVKEFLELQQERKSMPKQEMPFVQISTYKKINEVARMCHLDGEIGVIYGEAGLGKTMAVKRYAEKNKKAILIEADLGLTVKTLFRELHEIVGLDGEGSVHDMFEGIVERLKGSGRFIIIDEAEHLPYRALDLVRRVYDKAGVGILLVGMPRLIKNLRGYRGEYAQLFSRVSIAVKLDELKSNDTQEIVGAAIANSNGVWKSFHEASGGNARILSKLIRGTQRIAKINRTQITPDIVKETAKMLLI